MLRRALLIAIALGFAGTPALARSLQIAGTAGYLSEWELTGAAAERTTADGSEFVGSLVWKHVGLCSVNGPEERAGTIRFRISQAGPLPQIDAAISFGGAQCVYRGEVNSSSGGHMDCSDAQGVPISISIK